MTTILAAINGSPASRSVMAVASAMASLLEGSVDAIHVRGSARGDDGEPGFEPSTTADDVDVRIIRGDPVDEIVAEAADPDVVLAVVGARRLISGPRPAGHVALAVVERSNTPVLVVPPDTPAVEGARSLNRALVPLEGTAEGSEAVADILHRLDDAGVELLGVHVFDVTDIPAFWGEPGHTERSWADTFLVRWSSTPGLDLRLRRGEVAEAILDLVGAETIDLIALAWSQNLEPGRAQVVRALVAQSDVPVLLVPV